RLAVLQVSCSQRAAATFDCLILLFFSSRRRHTGSKRDWSSDVCSSDLGKVQFEHFWNIGQHHRHCIVFADTTISQRRSQLATARSEERRVGKEGRPRWGTVERTIPEESATRTNATSAPVRQTLTHSNMN